MSIPKSASGEVDPLSNLLDCPEVRHYQRQALEGVIVITYEVRQPGETDWQPVRLVKLT